MFGSHQDIDGLRAMDNIILRVSMVIRQEGQGLCLGAGLTFTSLVGEGEPAKETQKEQPIKSALYLLCLRRVGYSRV